MFTVIESETGSQKFTHSPDDIIEQFISQPISFVNFLEENYLPHFSNIDHVDKAASAISDADFMLAEWRVTNDPFYWIELMHLLHYVFISLLILTGKNVPRIWFVYCGL